MLSFLFVLIRWVWACQQLLRTVFYINRKPWKISCQHCWVYRISLNDDWPNLFDNTCFYSYGIFALLCLGRIFLTYFLEILPFQNTPLNNEFNHVIIHLFATCVNDEICLKLPLRCLPLLPDWEYNKKRSLRIFICLHMDVLNSTILTWSASTKSGFQLGSKVIFKETYMSMNVM